MHKQVKQRFGIIGNAPILDRAIDLATQVAATDMGVLIYGENGSGKESFAQMIHALSPRRHAPFIAINCGAIPEGTIDAELFGHEKGAFTSASESRKGYFEEADSGTLFLDEIGEMPLHTQPRLLRVLENKEFMRVGSSQKKKTDTRVLAATNIDLQAMVAKRRFREDLFYRIAQVQIIIPPLRERGEDIFLLFRKFALDFAIKYNTPPLQLTPEAKALLLSYPFPGNIRQLKNITWQLATFEGKDPLITKERLASYLPLQPKTDRLPMLLTHQGSDNGSQEDRLWQMLLNMQKEIYLLKKIMANLLQRHPRKVSDEQSDIPLIERISQDQEGVLSRLTTELPLAAAQHEDIVAMASPAKASEPVDETKKFSLKEQEKILIKKAIAESKNYKLAAKRLGIAERTLYRKINEYKLS